MGLDPPPPHPHLSSNVAMNYDSSKVFTLSPLALSRANYHLDNNSENYGGYSDYSSCERHPVSNAGRVQEVVNPAIEKAMNALKFVAQHVKNEDNFESFADDWKYVAMVLDRILLWIFTLACVLGTAGIIMAAPSHYDSRKPIDIQFSKVDKISALKTMLPESTGFPGR